MCGFADVAETEDVTDSCVATASTLHRAAAGAVHLGDPSEVALVEADVGFDGGAARP